jgi:hypothetical protein
MKNHPHLSTVLAWLTAEIESGPVRQMPNAIQIRAAIETGDEDYVTKSAWTWLNKMSEEHSRWRQQALWCFEIIDNLNGPATVVDFNPWFLKEMSA